MPRTLVSIAFACGFLLSSPAARAQEPPLPPPPPRIPMDPAIRFSVSVCMQIDHAEVHRELGLTEEQRTKATAIFRAYRDDLGARVAKIPRGATEDIHEAFKLASGRAVDSLKGLLKPGQFARLEQIATQAMGMGAFERTEVIRTLGITDDQCERIDAIVVETNRAIRDLLSTAREDPETALRTARALRAHGFRSILDVLTMQQRNAWDEFTGKPFKLEEKPPGR